MEFLTKKPISPGERIALGVLLVLTCGLLVYQAWRTGITIDEPGHLVGADLYWEGADQLPPGDMPPLIKLVGGWVPRLFDLPLADDLGRPGDTRREWEVSLAMLEHMPPARIGRFIFASRLPMIVFPLLSILILWRWVRELLSPATAIVAAALLALEPTALAHGALFKNDHAATFGYLLFWYAVWRYWRAPSARGAALVALAVALAMTAKLSLLFVFGAAPVLMVLANVRAGRIQWARTLATAAGVCLGAYLLVIAAAQFDIRRLNTADLIRLGGDRSLPVWFTAASRLFTVIPVPSRMWAGTVSLMSGFAYQNPVYLLGQTWPHGHPFYFVAALLVKAPITLLVFGFAGVVLVAIAAARWKLAWSDLFWILPGPLYVFLCSRVPVQLGVRLILPALPFGILMAAYAMERFRSARAGRIAIAAGLALFAAETASIYPNGIAFFNAACGGAGAGYRYLSDSNLDWGQGLGELRRWQVKNKVPAIRLSYFGADMMYRYFRDFEVQPIPPPWNDTLAQGRTQLAPEPGWYYAISPTLLSGQFFPPKYRDYYGIFRNMRPIARPGYSIFVYRVDPVKR